MDSEEDEVDNYYVTAHDSVENITDFQASLYQAKSEDDPVALFSHYAYPNEITINSAHSTHRLKCENTPASGSQYIYKVEGQMHKLRRVYATLKLPKISVLKNYRKLVRIAFCPNLFHNIFTKCTFTVNCGNKNSFRHTINTFFLDGYRSRDCPKQGLYDHYIGNRPELIEWSRILETTDPLILPIPFYFTESEKIAFPLHFYPGSVSIVCTFNLNLEKLIQMQMNVSDDPQTKEWVKIPPDIQYLQYGKEPELSIPHIYGNYTLLSKSELEDESEGYSIVIADNEYLKDTKIQQEEDKIAIPSGLALRGLRYAYLNLKAASFNNHSNYSVDHNNFQAGKDPEVKYSVSWSKATNPLIKPRSSFHTSLIPLFYDLRVEGNPESRNFHDIMWDVHRYSIFTESTINCRDSHLAVKLLERAESTTERHNKKLKAKNIADLTPEERIRRHVEQVRSKNDPDLMDDSISKYFLFKGYARVTRRLIFEKGKITVEQ